MTEMKTLLVNHAYLPLSFISWKKVIKLVVKDKVYIDAYWEEGEITYNNGFNSFKHPAVIRLKKYTPFHVKRRRYNRGGVFKRDKNICQYCGLLKKVHDLTIDHVFPRFRFFCLRLTGQIGY